jgi:methylenetetrahydrofolate dehydrogenase (NADP+)/methenyltetrahydrofolate cyclohydrolase
MANVLKGAPVAAALVEDTGKRVAALADEGIQPRLAILRVGERPDDLAYERGAVKRCDAVGIQVEHVVLDAACTQEDLMAAIDRINADASVHGCLMMRPLPKQLDERAACNALDPAKDVDCLTPGSLYGVFAGTAVGFPPCTAQACLELLDFYGIDPAGKRVTVVGRSLVIGRPVSMMLQARDATVTMCHSRTPDTAAECRRADIVVVAAGHARMVGKDFVAPGQTVVDVGINWDERAGKLVGDVAFDEVEPVVAAITPVPGGLGSITTAVLVKHVAMAAERQAGRV